MFISTKKLAVLVLLSIALSAGAQTNDATKTPLAAKTNIQTWNGTLDVGVQKLRVVFEIKKSEDGALSGIMKSIDQGDAEIRLDDVKFSEGTLDIKVNSIDGGYSGTIDQEKKTIEGTWTQFGRKLPLLLSRGVVKNDFELFETWQGNLEVAGQKLKLQFRRMKDPKGEEKLLLDSLTQRVMGIAAELTVKEEKVTISVPTIAAKFVGQLNETSDKTTGKWSQLGTDYALELVKVEKADELKPVDRPQHPKKPYPYREQSLKFRNDEAAITLAGTLTLPNNSPDDAAVTKFPAVVLVSGSGPQDRDESLLDHKPFLVLADFLTRRGIAVLRYDDRGVGDSTGDFGSATSEDFASDATAAVAFLRSQGEINGKRIGIIGHSEGGLIAPLVALQSDLAHIILLAGPGVDGGEILKSQTAAISKTMGILEKDLAVNNQVMAKLVQALRDGADQSTMKSVIDSEIAAAKKRAEDSAADETKLALLQASVQALNTDWFRFFVKHDPAEPLRQVKCPVLAMIGEKDLQVLVDVNMPAIEQALQSGGNTDYRCEVLPGLNHLFQESATGAPAEYQTISQTMSPRALEMVAEWVLSH